MTSLAVHFFLVTFTSASLVGQQLTMRHIDDGRVVDHVAIDEELDSFEAAKKISLVFLQQYSGERTMVRLIIASNEEDARRSIGRGENAGGYERSIEAIERSTFRGSIAHILAIGDAAFLAYRKGNELRREVILGGRNPTEVTARGLKFEILHVRLDHVQPRSDYNFYVYARSMTSLSAGAVGELTEMFKQFSRATSVFVIVRPDIWFLEEAEFPQVLLWAARDKPPTKFDYMRAPQLACFIFTQKLACTGKNFVP